MRILLLMSLVLSTGCASQKAGLLVADAQREFGVYQRNANTKIEESYAARLELELRIFQSELEALFARNPDPATAAQQTVDMLMKKMAEHDARLAKWHETDESAAMINLELSAIKKYHGEGISAEDVIPTVDRAGAVLSEYVKARKAAEAAKIKVEVPHVDAAPAQ